MSLHSVSHSPSPLARYIVAPVAPSAALMPPSPPTDAIAICAFWSMTA